MTFRKSLQNLNPVISVMEQCTKKFRNYVSGYKSKNLPLDIAKKEEEDMIILELRFVIFFLVDLH